MSLALGVDIGGTKIAAGLVAEDGTILAEAREETPGDADAIPQTVAGLVTQLRAGHDVAGVGIGAAGFVDAARANVMFAPNIAWVDEPLATRVRALVDLPVVVENDANVAAWGEFRFGAGEDTDNLLLVTVGTGIGGGIVHNGSLLRGGFGVAAEIGHMRVVPDGILCGCGQRGCFEQYASGRALVRLAQERAEAGDGAASTLLARAGGDAEAITGPMVTELAQQADALSIELLVEVGHWLGQGIATLCSVLDPSVVVIGGGVSAAGSLLLGPAQEDFATYLSAGSHRPQADLRLASLGNDAGLIGAADLVRVDPVS